MKKVLLMMCLIAGFGKVSAQDEATFSDEDLTKYATVMVWAEMEKGKMTEVYNGWINNDPTLEATRFVEIKSAKGDSLKLQELAVSNDEKVAFEKIQMSYDSMTASFKDVYIGKIKTDIGAGLYNTLKKALKADADVKARYKVVYDAIAEESKTTAEEESEE
ncbi:hypothetical protein [Ekhidna sp. To15]|uniref:hypothetical protein n=1 Tax=Ekhidna sp. To15 TaxID=3395267 RepID=UPI003F520C6E